MKNRIQIDRVNEPYSEMIYYSRNGQYTDLPAKDSDQKPANDPPAIVHFNRLQVATEILLDRIDQELCKNTGVLPCEMIFRSSYPEYENLPSYIAGHLWRSLAGDEHKREEVSMIGDQVLDHALLETEQVITKLGQNDPTLNQYLTQIVLEAKTLFTEIIDNLYQSA